MSLPSEAIDWVERENGYRTASYSSSYGDVDQRWLLGYSEQAYQRERKTLEKKLNQQQAQLHKRLWHLGTEVFQCDADAHKAIQPLIKRYGHFTLSLTVEAIERYPKAGRPRPGEGKMIASDMPIGLLVRDGKEHFENGANGDGPVLGREHDIADVLRFIKHNAIQNVVWLTADVHYTAAHYYDPNQAQFQDFNPFWEFVSGPLMPVVSARTIWTILSGRK